MLHGSILNQEVGECKKDEAEYRNIVQYIHCLFYFKTKKTEV
jgi:hypothetical protein